jgi:hypothetical protein
MVTQRLFAILCLVALTAGAAHADMWLESAIDLGVHFGPAGNNPMNVVSDDAYAYIGGYNGSGVDRDISILKISLSDPNDAVVLNSATQTANYGRFYDGLVIRNGVLYALCDRPLGSGTCNLRAIDAATDTLVPTFDGDLGNGNGILSGSNFPVPCASPFPGGGLAYDPGFGGQDSGCRSCPTAPAAARCWRSTPASPSMTPAMASPSPTSAARAPFRTSPPGATTSMMPAATPGAAAPTRCRAPSATARTRPTPGSI